MHSYLVPSLKSINEAPKLQSKFLNAIAERVGKLAQPLVCLEVTWERSIPISATLTKYLQQAGE